MPELIIETSKKPKNARWELVTVEDLLHNRHSTFNRLHNKLMFSLLLFYINSPTWFKCLLLADKWSVHLIIKQLKTFLQYWKCINRLTDGRTTLGLTVGWTNKVITFYVLSWVNIRLSNSLYFLWSVQIVQFHTLKYND